VLISYSCIFPLIRFFVIDLIITGSKDGSFRIWDTRFNQKPGTDSGRIKEKKGRIIKPCANKEAL
jgi:WD40 repeat protein